MKRLPFDLCAMIDEEGQDRSTHCFTVMMGLFAAGLTDDEVCVVAAGAAFARKFSERGDLENEIKRARAKWQADEGKRKPKRGRPKKAKGPSLYDEDGNLVDEDGFMLSERDGETRLANEHNTLLAFKKMGLTLTYSDFSNEVFVHGLAGYEPVLSDLVLKCLWLTLARDFKFKPSKEGLDAIIEVEAQRHRFHPVRDYLKTLTWDQRPRIDEWLTTYLGADDDEQGLTREFGKIVLVAAAA